MKIQNQKTLDTILKTIDPEKNDYIFYIYQNLNTLISPEKRHLLWEFFIPKYL